MALEDIRAVQLSRWAREGKRNWMQKLVNRPGTTEHLLNLQLRGAQTRVSLVAECGDEAFLDALAWLEAPGLEIPLEAARALLLDALERGRELLLGILGDAPELARPARHSWRQRRLLSLASQPAGVSPWRSLCRLMRWTPEAQIEAIREPLLEALEAWPSALRSPPRSWLERLRGEGRASPRLAYTHLERLEIDEGPASLAKAVADSRLSSLRELALRGCSLVGQDAERLSASSALSGLRHLDLSDNSGLGDEGARALGDAPTWGLLEVLYLKGGGIGAGGARALAQSPHLGSLRELGLGANSVGVEGARELASSIYLESLEKLWLWENAMGDAGAMAIAESRLPAKLFHLELGSNAIKERGARGLAESPHLAQLTFLNMRHNQVGDAGLAALASSTGLEQLEVLVLGDNGIGDAGLVALAGAAHLGRLKRLWLWGNPAISRVGIEALAGSELLGQLETLALSQCELERESIELLRASRGLKPGALKV